MIAVGVISFFIPQIPVDGAELILEGAGLVGLRHAVTKVLGREPKAE
jgi:hypothetical protein